MVGDKGFILHRIARIRQLMARDQVQAVIIPSGDPHMSEYFSEHWKTRRFVSGFTGSVGTYVITENASGLWVDGRYYVQAEKQIADSEAVLFRASEPDCPTFSQYLLDNLAPNSVVGLNGKLFSLSMMEQMQQLFAQKGITLNIQADYGNDIWEDRPAEEYTPAYYFDEKYCGKSAAQKLSEVRDALAKQGCDALVVGRLDNSNWLFNVRANDIPNSPIAISYGFVSGDQAVLFTALSRVSAQAAEQLAKNGVTLREYEDIYPFLSSLQTDAHVLCDPDEVNYLLYNQMQNNSHLTLVKGVDPIPMMKAVKNETEIANTRLAYLKDGCAEAEFYGWLFEALEKGETVTEWKCSQKIAEFRAQQKHYVSESFTAIIAYRENAAMMHYAPLPQACSTIERENMLLNDSGGQYFTGTTDTTRTFAMGELTDEERRDYTIVLKSVIAMSTAVFKEGMTGYGLDILCREGLWKYGLDYRCGTGHGVGFLSAVHERPNGIRWRIVPERQDSCVLEEGMLTSDEPGLYIEGSHGIRTENLTMCRKAEKNEYGQFMCFENMTFAPIDLDAVDISVMEPSDVRNLNEYHKAVYEKLSPFMTAEENEWLKEATRPIGEDYTWRI